MVRQEPRLHATRRFRDRSHPDTRKLAQIPKQEPHLTQKEVTRTTLLL